MLVLRNNPIRETRKALGLTLERASKEIGIHLQALYLQEQGCHPDIFPSILTWVRRHELWRHDFESDYHEFQHGKRVEGGEIYGFSMVELSEPGGNPMVSFRKELAPEISRSGFAKRFCIHPGVLYRVEIVGTKNLPVGLVSILKESGLSDKMSSELDYRMEEWYGSE